MKDTTLPLGETYTEHLSDLITVALEPLKLLFETLEGGADQKISTIGRTLHDTAVMQIEEAFDLVDKQIGQVYLTGACYHNSKSIPGGKLLSAQLNH